ncbi:MAG: hypothetical protein OET41_08205 [Xanthomonadales bacterium]|nr:hypothetical protein [Xanthomonadales bacterium]
MKVLKLLVLVASLLYIQAVIAEVVSDEEASAADRSAQKSLYQKNNDTNFWFEQIEGDHTVYWEFIEAYDTVKESLVNVAKRLACYVADLGVGREIFEGDDCFNYT